MTQNTVESDGKLPSTRATLQECGNEYGSVGTARLPDCTITPEVVSPSDLRSISHEVQISHFALLYIRKCRKSVRSLMSSPRLQEPHAPFKY